MARRRSRRYTWFPIFGTDYETAPPAQGEVTFYHDAGNLSLSAPVAIGQLGNIIAIPLLRDSDIDSDTVGEQISLRDRVEGKDYFVERVVGKTWAALKQEQAGSEEEIGAAVIVATAFAVLPVNEAGQPAQPGEQYSPLRANNSAQPWMWRRTWTLWNNLALDLGGNFYTGPTNVASYGSVADGGHIDIKSVRRVRREERLFIIAQAALLQNAAGNTSEINTSMEIVWGYDVRVLGAMRRARNQSTF